MSRRGYDEYERAMGDPRSLAPREAQRERDSRQLIDPQRRRVEDRDPERLEYSRDSRSDRTFDNRLDRRSDRDLASRPLYSYASTDEIDRDDLYSRGYMDLSQDRHRPPIHLKPERREEVSSRYLDYFLPGEGINREVIQYDICRYLGDDATVRPYTHSDGRQGYLIKAYQALTTAMISTLKQDSIRFENAQAARQQSAQSVTTYSSPTLFEDRQRQGRPDLPGQRYAGDDVDMDIGDSARGYSGPELRTYSMRDSRMDLRMDSGMDSFSSVMDPRDSRMDQEIYGTIGSNRRPTYYTMDPRANPRLPLPRVSESVYGAGYPASTSRAYSVSTTATSGPDSAYVDPTTGRLNVENQAGARHPGWGDTPNFRESGPGV